MKKLLSTSLILIIAVILGACGEESVQPSETVELGSSEGNKESNTKNVDGAEENNKVQSEEDNVVQTNEQSLLKEYTNEQIEYARVWLQLGPNQEIDELNITRIAAGTPLNPDDETSAVYPKDVIQLAGSRLVDGYVTYSGNGDGTINVYNVPLRWDGKYPAGEQFYQDILKNTKLVSIETGEDEEVIKLIKLQKNVMN